MYNEMRYICADNVVRLYGGGDMGQISMRIDDQIKKKAEIACEALGLNMTTAITLYLVKLGNEMRIPFEVSVDPFYSKEYIDMLERRVADMKEGRNVHEHELIEVD